MTNKALKQAMVNHMKKCGETIAPMSMDSTVWGKGAMTNAWRITSKHTKKASTMPAGVRNFLFPLPKYRIQHDYKAVHHSGNVAKGVKKVIVIHDMEVDAPNTAAEAVGNYFEMGSSGGSTQYGIDNNSIQQYLPPTAIPWGAPYVNTQGIHIEQMGKAGWSTEKWKTRAKGTIDRCAWLVAKLSIDFNIPIDHLSVAELRAGKRGVVTHYDCTKAFGGSHTDPGPQYPLKMMLDKAKEYKKSMS